MEPFARTGIVITRDHLAETDLVAVAVPRLAFLVLVVSLVERLFVRRDDRRLEGGFLGIAPGCRVCASRGSGPGLTVLRQGWEHGC